MASNSSSIHLDLKTLAMDFVPNALAMGMLRGLVHQQDEQLKGLDDEISQLRFHLHTLEEQRAKVAESRRLHLALLAPIRKLAPEILGEVFMQHLLHYRSTCSQSTSDRPTSDVRLPLLLVCQRWKRIAIGTPGLWTFSLIGPAPWKSHSGLQMCLDNSGCLPIQVQLDRHGSESSVHWIRLLLHNFHRVAEIKGYSPHLMNQILCQKNILQTRLLKVVRLVGEGSSRRSKHGPLCFESIIEAPPIESLELKNCTNLFSAFCRKPGKLQHLKVEEESDLDVYTPALLDILPFTSSLQSLDLLLPDWMITFKENARTISLPHLRSLTVKG